jgi:Flp pilus assembly protein CpaB
MKRIGLIVVLGLASMLAVFGIIGAFLYPDGVIEEPKILAPLVAVTVFAVDVPAGTDLDQLIKDDQLRIIQVPPDAVVDGAVTSVDQLEHRRNTVAIQAGEQIPTGWLKNGG